MNVGDLEDLIERLKAQGSIDRDTPLSGEFEGLLCDIVAIGMKQTNIGAVPRFVVTFG